MTYVPSSANRPTPPWYKKKWVWAVGLVVVIVIIASRGGRDKTGGPSTGGGTSGGPATVGERVESGGVALTVEKVDRTQSLGTLHKADGGKIYVVADVLIETTGKDKAPYNPLYFKAKDADGHEVNTSMPGFEDCLKSGQLPKGEKVRGKVAFEVKEGTKGLVLSYKPLVLGGGYKEIRVALE
jgi:hypothetical protein